MAAIGHITVASAGTPVQGPDVSNEDGFLLRMYTTGETGWFFPWGETAADDGAIVDTAGWSYTAITNLADLGFDAETNGDEIAYVKA